MKDRIFYRIRENIIKIASPILSDKMFIKLKFRHRMGYWLDEKNPKTFCEKIQWLKLNTDFPELTSLVDKVDAKAFVASIVGEQYLIPTLGVWNKFDEIDFEKLPDGFILKCAHDSSKGVVVRDKTLMDIPTMKKRMEYFQGKTYYLQNREYPYKNVPHRLIAEKFLVNGTDSELKDYKFYCFNGRAVFCQLIAGRTTKETIDFYDRNWVHQEFIGLNPRVEHAPNLEPCPQHLDEMLSVADKLASAIRMPFVRVDLYNVNGQVYFGELTFFPGSGLGAFKPCIWDRKLGDMIDLSKLKSM